MAIPVELQQFVREGLAVGQSRADVESVLVRAGWAREHVTGALNAFADLEFPIPVPRPTASLSARDAFLYLVLFSTLYTTAYHTGNVLFQFIDMAFPDPTIQVFTSIGDRIRFSVSALIVAFPVFAFVARLTGREVRQDPVKRSSAVRRWLTYLTLFVASGVLIGDTIAVVYSFLGGELTIRFVLKALVIGLIGGAVFGYYLADLRKDEAEQGR